MQITETRSEGLRRELEVVVPSDDLGRRLDVYLNDMRAKVRLKGFRPGKVPLPHLKRLYGRAAMAEIVNEIVNESVKNAVEERKEKPALKPDVSFDETAMEGVVAGNADLSFKLSYEVLPHIEAHKFDDIVIERPVAKVSQEEVDQEVQTLAERNRPFEPKTDPAADGDKLRVDFTGRLDGEPFDGGSAEDQDIVLGSGQLIPGFEEQLIGVSAGEERPVTITFPQDYPVEQLAGREAVFDVVVKEVAAPQEVAVDDQLAERLGLESLEKLKDAIRDQMQQSLDSATRQRVKRALLDRLDETYNFALPEQLVRSEFEGIWQQVQAERRQVADAAAVDVEDGTPAEAGTPTEDGAPAEESASAEEGASAQQPADTDEAKLGAEYRAIAERRVKLGLVLSQIGEEAKVEISDEEVQRSLYDRIRQFPGQEREVLDYYRKNPQAMASLRAPLFEEKVVDYILELVNLKDVEVDRQTLLADPDGEDHEHDHEHHHHDHKHHGHDHDHHDHDHGHGH